MSVEREAPTKDLSEAAVRPRRLLVVDPTEPTRTAIAASFEARGWDVVGAADGVTAITRVVARDVDAVILTVALPDFQGYEVASILRRLHPGMPIVLMSDDTDSEPHEVRHIERFRCFPRPVDLAAVALAIDEPHPADRREREDEP